jgi:ferredoxin
VRSIETVKVTVDHESCTACELCNTTVPEVFEIRDGASRVLVPEVPRDLEADVREAASYCPTEAITITE